MTARLHFLDARDVADLHRYADRARRLSPDGAARLVAAGGVLTVTVNVLDGSGLTGSGAVLGLRASAVHAGADADALVGLGDLVAATDAAMTAATPVVDVPVSARIEPWAGMTPPRGGWEPAGEYDVGTLLAAAREGIAAIASFTAGAKRAHLVDDRRRAVWGERLMPPSSAAALPAGAAFAAYALGFLPRDGALTAYTCGSWRRLSSPAGHVLCRV